MNKKLFRCKICQDIHFGIDGPEICPTCKTKDAYEETDVEEAKKVMGI